MTTMAALLGGLPLAVGSGTGAELRRPLGITIVGGLLLSQVLTLFTTPIIYLYLDRAHYWYEKKHEARRRRKAARQLAADGTDPGRRLPVIADDGPLEH